MSRQRQLSIAPQQNLQNKTFRITHPFHPQYNQEFEIYSIKKPHGESRVYFYNLQLRMVSVPINWTDIEPADPFVKISDGRALFRIKDLLRLVILINNIKRQDRNEKI
ncbi:DUF5372 family protein [Thermodesulfobacteriota bacterium]